MRQLKEREVLNGKKTLKTRRPKECEKKRERERGSIQRSLIRRFNSININNSLAFNAHNEPMTNVAKKLLM